MERKTGIRGKLSVLMICVGVLTVLLVGTCWMYLADYYPADLNAIEAFAPEQTIAQITLDDGTILMGPDNARTGLIFYPGGKVEHLAYIPLMEQLASEGILCFIVRMPFRLAVFDVDAADRIIEQYPQVEKWYIGGHSLGGSMAASYLADHEEVFSGLFLLGSYSTADLSDAELDVLSVYGSEDRVLNREKYAENRSNLPADLMEIEIPGGCHAYFGMYGPQSGDGEPTVTNEEQILITAAAILERMS